MFCGMAASTVSAKRQAYYAGPGNKFWNVIYQASLTPRRLEPEEYREALKYGIGFTDMIKDQSGMDSQLSQEQVDRRSVTKKILEYAPAVLCFNGKKAAQRYWGLAASGGVRYGKQPLTIGNTMVFVLPSTSGAANRWWNEKYWLEAAACIKAR